MPVCLIQVPYTIGDEHYGASKGAERLMERGAGTPPVANAVMVTVDRAEPFVDHPNASLAVSRQIETRVRQALAARQLPVVLAGSCEVGMGILSAFDHARCGIVWIDAHGDFNTPESTLSGFFGGMPLAVLTGHCYRDLWAQIGNSKPIAEADVLLLGTRDLDPPEAELLERSNIEIVYWREGEAQADVPAALDVLATRVREVYLHVDIDALDPEVAPGVDYPVPGGLSPADMEAAIRAVAERFQIRAAAVTAFNPENDRDDKTAQAALRIVALLAEYAGD